MNSNPKQVNNSELVSAAWFFELMANLFGKEWTAIYKPGRTRAMKTAKAEWARVICEHDKTFVEFVAKKARQCGSVPPSSLMFWVMLSRERAALHVANPKPPPDRALGRASIESAMALLGGR